MKKEIFGPILPALRYTSDDQRFIFVWMCGADVGCVFSCLFAVVFLFLFIYPSKIAIRIILSREKPVTICCFSTDIDFQNRILSGLMSSFFFSFSIYFLFFLSLPHSLILCFLFFFSILINSHFPHLTYLPFSYSLPV